MKKVLVVDDNENILHVLKELLEVEGFEVATMARGTGVLETVQYAKPDFVLLDIALGNANGYDIYKALKANLGTRETPVLLMSAADSEESLAKMDLKLEDFISKPFSMKHLMGKMNRLAA